MRGVYHHDFKPKNPLLDEAENLKVANFGHSALTCHTPSYGLLHTACGTLAYVTPEVLVRNSYNSAKADLWSSNIILYVLLADALLFQDENLVCMYHKMRRGEFSCPTWLMTDARKLIKMLLDPNPDTHITVAGLLETLWFRKKALVPRSITDLTPAPMNTLGNADDDKDEPPEVLNAFHLIPLSEGFDLSLLFEHDPAKSSWRATVRAGSMWFAMCEPAKVLRGEDKSARPRQEWPRSATTVVVEEDLTSHNSEHGPVAPRLHSILVATQLQPQSPS